MYPMPIIAGGHDTYPCGPAGEMGSHHLMMLAGRLMTRAPGSGKQITDVMLPPAVLSDITARTIHAAMKARVHEYMPARAVPGSSLGLGVFILNTDSHSALKRVANHYASLAKSGDFPLMLHGRCMMHMFFAALVSMLSPMKLTNSMYCSTVLLHKGGNMRNLREQVRLHVARHLRVVYAKPPDHRMRNSAVLRILDLLDHDSYSSDTWCAPPPLCLQC